VFISTVSGATLIAGIGMPAFCPFAQWKVSFFPEEFVQVMLFVQLLHIRG
jgi:hypothetical protein